ncbi:MAG: hypothetical protein KGL40_00630 [Rhodocyclaceae bacterium]|nr:hypothetical protein [Rhodocyclaceae bacterium]
MHVKRITAMHDAQDQATFGSAGRGDNPWRCRIAGAAGLPVTRGFGEE